jgi:hypothetical protein
MHTGGIFGCDLSGIQCPRAAVNRVDTFQGGLEHFSRRGALLPQQLNDLNCSQVAKVHD